MQRILKCDGLLPEKRGPDGQPADVTPEDGRAMNAFVQANRTPITPSDIVMQGKTDGVDRARQQDQLSPWQEASATWWVEGLWGELEEAVVARIRHGPPQVA